MKKPLIIVLTSVFLAGIAFAQNGWEIINDPYRGEVTRSRLAGAAPLSFYARSVCPGGTIRRAVNLNLSSAVPPQPQLVSPSFASPEAPTSLLLHRQAAPAADSHQLQIDTAPDTPRLIAPPDGFVSDSARVTLIWSTAARAVSYTVEVSGDSSFSPAVMHPNLVDTVLVLDNLQYDTTTYWRVRARNSRGISGWSGSRTLLVEAPTTAPGIPRLAWPDSGATEIPINPVLRWHPVAGAAAYRLELASAPNFSPALHYDNLPDTLKALDQLSFGRQYFWRVRALTAKLEAAWSSPRSFSTLPPYPQQYALHAQIDFPEPPAADAFQASDYRLISLPGDSRLPVDSVLTGEYGRDWKLFWDNGREQDYFMEYTGPGVFFFVPGRAYWVIHRGPVRIDRTIRTAILDTAGQVAIPLHAGWNLIANPFSEAISWPVLQRLNKIDQPLWAFSGEFAQSAVLKPYAGYYFYNTASLPALRVPYNAIFANSASAAVGPDTLWKVRAVLQADEGPVSAVSFGRIDGKGRRLFKPRSPAGEAVLALHSLAPTGADGALQADFRAVAGPGAVWTLVVRQAEDRAFSLHFRGLASLPAGEQLWLWEAHTQRAVDLRQNQRIRVPAGGGEWRCRIIAGETQYVQQALLASGRPAKFELGQNYPNPFNPATTFAVRVPRKENIVLEIYNLLGQRVRTLFAGALEAGAYRFTWDAKDDRRQPLPSGMYLYRLRAGAVVIGRKMILLQ